MNKNVIITILSFLLVIAIGISVALYTNGGKLASQTTPIPTVTATPKPTPTPSVTPTATPVSLNDIKKELVGNWYNGGEGDMEITSNGTLRQGGEGTWGAYCKFSLEKVSDDIYVIGYFEKEGNVEYYKEMYYRAKKGEISETVYFHGDYTEMPYKKQ